LRTYPFLKLKYGEKAVKIKKVVIFTDGGAEPNPGPAAIGAIIRDERGRVISTVSQAIGRATNNQAEYRAIIAALEKAITLGAQQVEMCSDSELVVRQINGQYRVKNASLKPLYQQAKQLQSQFGGFTITHIPGPENTEAHNLASMALK
jgi:ribonuclease HI